MTSSASSIKVITIPVSGNVHMFYRLHASSRYQNAEPKSHLKQHLSIFFVETNINISVFCPPKSRTAIVWKAEKCLTSHARIQKIFSGGGGGGGGGGPNSQKGSDGKFQQGKN